MQLNWARQHEGVLTKLLCQRGRIINLEVKAGSDDLFEKLCQTHTAYFKVNLKPSIVLAQYLQ